MDLYLLWARYREKLIYLGFYRNRFLRTYLFFLFFLILGIAFNTENFSIVAMLQSVFFMENNYIAINGGAFTFVFWPIAVEWYFYLLFPF